MKYHHEHSYRYIIENQKEIGISDLNSFKYLPFLIQMLKIPIFKKLQKAIRTLIYKKSIIHRNYYCNYNLKSVNLTKIMQTQ